MAQNNAADEEQDANYDVDDVLGQRIFNPSTGMGKGVALETRTAHNGHGDERYVFECATEPGRKTTLRDVDDVLESVNEGNYELRSDPWADER